jgi:cell division protein FtsL
LFILFALVFVWSNHQAVQVGYAISELHREHARLNDLNRKYKVELANLTALDRLEHLAINELGLVAPRPEQIQVIE